LQLVLALGGETLEDTHTTRCDLSFMGRKADRYGLGLVHSMGWKGGTLDGAL